MSPSQHNSLLYHLLMGVGFVALVGWFALMRELEFMAWVTALGPASHAGAMNMLAIMLWMLPAFLLWKYYVRWLNRRLKVGGIYYEDSYYGSGPQPPKTAKSQQPESTTAADTENAAAHTERRE